MYQKILVPLDGSELAESALMHAQNMVQDGFAQEVTVVNVVWVHIMPFEYGYKQAGYVELGEKIKEDTMNYLADVEARLAALGIKVKTELLEGDRPARMIADYAQENGIDLIMLATHGYTGLKKMMLGSVALEILHDSHVPVLLIRPESCRM